MSPSEQSESSQEPSSYRPTILPASPVNLGFIPERRRRHQPSTQRFHPRTADVRFAKTRRLALAELERLFAEFQKKRLIEIEARLRAEIEQLNEKHDELHQQSLRFQELRSEPLDRSSRFEEAEASAVLMVQEADEAPRGQQVEAE